MLPRCCWARLLQTVVFISWISSSCSSCSWVLWYVRYAERHFSLTVDFQDMSSIFAVSCCFCDSDHVVSAVLQPQVWQAHGAISVGLHSAAVIHRYVGVHPRLPSPYGAAHRSWHKSPLYGGDPNAGYIHWEKHILLHRPGEAPLGRINGDGSSFQRDRDEEMWI